MQSAKNPHDTSTLIHASHYTLVVCSTTATIACLTGCAHSRILRPPTASDLAVAANGEGHLQHPLLATTVKAKDLVSIPHTLTRRPECRA